jgi:hypothetical protein
VKEVLLHEGTDARYGARHLKRSIERLIVLPMSNLVASGQVRLGDVIDVDLDHNGSDISFAKCSMRTTDDSFLIESTVDHFSAAFDEAPLSQQAAA